MPENIAFQRKWGVFKEKKVSQGFTGSFRFHREVSKFSGPQSASHSAVILCVLRFQWVGLPPTPSTPLRIYTSWSVSTSLSLYVETTTSSLPLKLGTIESASWTKNQMVNANKLVGFKLTVSQKPDYGQSQDVDTSFTTDTEVYFVQESSFVPRFNAASNWRTCPPQSSPIFPENKITEVSINVPITGKKIQLYNANPSSFGNVIPRKGYGTSTL